MEENATSPHPDYLKGFNEGYLLNKHQPDLAKSINDSLNESQRSMGIKDGMAEFTKEISFDRRPAFLQKDRLSKLHSAESKPREPDKERE